MHGHRYASKYIPQGEAVAQVEAKPQLVVLVFCCPVCVLSRSAENSVHISIRGKALVLVEYLLSCPGRHLTRMGDLVLVGWLVLWNHINGTPWDAIFQEKGNKNKKS